MTDDEKKLLIELNNSILSLTQMLNIHARNIMQLQAGVAEHLLPKFNDFMQRNQHLIDPKIEVADATALRRPRQ